MYKVIIDNPEELNEAILIYMKIPPSVWETDIPDTNNSNGIGSKAIDNFDSITEISYLVCKDEETKGIILGYIKRILKIINYGNSLIEFGLANLDIYDDATIHEEAYFIVKLIELVIDNEWFNVKIVFKDKSKESVAKRIAEGSWSVVFNESDKKTSSKKTKLSLILKETLDVFMRCNSLDVTITEL